MTVDHAGDLPARATCTQIPSITAFEDGILERFASTMRLPSRNFLNASSFRRKWFRRRGVKISSRTLIRASSSKCFLAK